MTDPIEPMIAVYECASAPASDRFLGFFFLGPKRLPVVFNSHDRAALIEGMREFWATEQAKKAESAANKAARIAKARSKMQ